MTSKTGKQVYYNTFATDIPVTRDNIAELAECARTRWAVKNSLFRELKKFCHLEHGFGHYADIGIVAMDPGHSPACWRCRA